MFEQHGHVVLDSVELIQVQVRVGNRENVAGLGLLVNEHALAFALELLLHLQDALAFEHDGEDEAGGSVPRGVPLDELPQERLGGVLLDGIGGRRRGFIDALPVRDEALGNNVVVAMA